MSSLPLSSERVTCHGPHAWEPCPMGSGHSWAFLPGPCPRPRDTWCLGLLQTLSTTQSPPSYGLPQGPILCRNIPVPTESFPLAPSSCPNSILLQNPLGNLSLQLFANFQRDDPRVILFPLFCKKKKKKPESLLLKQK